MRHKGHASLPDSKHLNYVRYVSKLQELLGQTNTLCFAAMDSQYMDESEINKLFMKVAGKICQVSEDVRKVFSALVSSTLHYRDQLKEDQGIVVTVEDVRGTLDWLLESIHTRRLPRTNNAVRLDLLKIWLDALKPYM